MLPIHMLLQIMSYPIIVIQKFVYFDQIIFLQLPILTFTRSHFNICNDFPYKFLKLKRWSDDLQMRDTGRHYRHMTSYTVRTSVKRCSFINIHIGVKHQEDNYNWWRKPECPEKTIIGGGSLSAQRKPWTFSKKSDHPSQ